MKTRSRMWSVGAVLVAAVAPFAMSAEPAGRPKTFANPINIDYRFQLNAPTRREAADPVILLFKDEYYLFASKSGGYWVSSDLVDWKFIKPADNVLPIEEYAPAVMAYEGALYYSACNIGLFKSTDPKSGKWENLGKPFNVGDPCLFADDDGKVYLYYGLAYNGNISVVELDPKNKFAQMGQPTVCMKANPAEHGWERRGDDNLGGMSGNNFQDGPWLEGSWMSKKGDTYYLQYAAPGTEFSTYADGVYTSKSPKGPFVYSQSSPFSAKPTGFITGAGHSATFADKQGRWWHISTMRISIKHDFERRLGLFPVEFDADGVMYTNTIFGDYPMIVPEQRKAGQANLSAGWMLLSYGKRGTASSSIESLEPKNAFDEDIRTYWSARTDKAGEFLTVNLNKQCRIDAVQVNFAEHEATAVGRNAETYHQYKLEASEDGTNWVMLADKSSSKVDAPHDYIQLATPVMANQVRITNVGMAGGGTFSIRDLRVFGSGMGNAPAAAPKFEAIRDASDKRNATIRWDIVNDATGYVIRYGIAPDKLYLSREIRGKKEISIHDLNVGADYYFAVDAFNDSGWTKGTPQKVK